MACRIHCSLMLFPSLIESVPERETSKRISRVLLGEGSFFVQWVSLALLLAAPWLGAQTVDATQWISGTVSLSSDQWRVHEGDDLEWAQQQFDDSGWKTVELDNLGAAQPGWRWYRRHVKLADPETFLHLLVQGGDGTYELYVNGKKAEGPELRSWFGVARPTERVIWVGKGYADLELALRTHAPGSYTSWHLPL